MTTEVPQTPLCDFCLSRTDASYVYGVKGPIFVSRREDNVEEFDDSPWYACEQCSLDIENRNIRGLLAGMKEQVDYLQQIGLDNTMILEDAHRRTASFLFNHTGRTSV